MYYVLNGGILGSAKETPRETDTIIVDLNYVYEKSQFNQIKAQESFSKQIAFAEKVYGVIEIKFYSTWTAGTGDWEARTITEGRKDSFVNLYLSVRKQKDGFAATDTVVDEKTGEITTKDIFLAKGQLEGGGITNYSLREEAFAHELGHKFGIVAYYGKKFRTPTLILAISRRTSRLTAQSVCSHAARLGKILTGTNLDEASP